MTHSTRSVGSQICESALLLVLRHLVYVHRVRVCELQERVETILWGHALRVSSRSARRANKVDRSRLRSTRALTETVYPAIRM